MSTLLAGPSNTFTIPWWVDLDASIEPNYSNDVYTDIAVPLSVTSASMLARSIPERRLERDEHGEKHHQSGSAGVRW